MVLCACFYFIPFSCHRRLLICIIWRPADRVGGGGGHSGNEYFPYFCLLFIRFQLKFLPSFHPASWDWEVHYQVRGKKAISKYGFPVFHYLMGRTFEIEMFFCWMLTSFYDPFEAFASTCCRMLSLRWWTGKCLPFPSYPASGKRKVILSFFDCNYLLSEVLTVGCTVWCCCRYDELLKWIGNFYCNVNSTYLSKLLRETCLISSLLDAYYLILEEIAFKTCNGNWFLFRIPK